MLRRLTLAIALITGSVQAEDLDCAEFTCAEDVDVIGSGTLDAGADVDVAADGALSGPVAWSVVRLVLPDLFESTGDPVWIEMPTAPRATRSNSLRALGGRVLVDRGGAAVGIVRRVLVSFTEGRVLALGVESAIEFDGCPRNFVVPWVEVHARGSVLQSRVDADWLRGATHGPSL